MGGGLLELASFAKILQVGLCNASAIQYPVLCSAMQSGTRDQAQVRTQTMKTSRIKPQISLQGFQEAYSLQGFQKPKFGAPSGADPHASDHLCRMSNLVPEG